MGERPQAGTRVWFALFVAWMTGLAGLALLLLGRYEQHGEMWAMRAWLLVLMCFYLTLCNSFVPLPTSWIILLAASPSYALVPHGWLNIVVVAGLSTLATIVANLNEYHLLAYLLRFGLGPRVRRTKVYGWAVRWFDKAPFQFLTLIAFIPIPVDAVRWLAILRGYSRRRFALAYLVGRGPRYLLLAGCSVLLELRPWQILVIQAAMVAIALVTRLIWRSLQSARRGSAHSDALAAETTIGASAGALRGEGGRC